MTDRACLHCGELLLSPAGEAEAYRFCCRGCETIYEFLQSGPLSDYYRIKEEGTCFKKSSPAIPGTQDYSFWSFEIGNPIRVYVEGIHCTACVWLLERLPLALPRDIAESNLDLSRSILTIYLKEGADRSLVARVIESFGYRPHLVSGEAKGAELLAAENRKRLVDLGIAGALAGNVMLFSIPLYSNAESSFRTLFEVLSWVLSVPALFYSGRIFFKNVFVGIRNRSFPVDGPILLALLVAWVYSTQSVFRGTHDLYFDSLTALIFLLLGSRYYLSRLRQSHELSPGFLSYFHAPFGGKVGDRLALESGDAVPADGRVISGYAWVDQSHFTGESEPVRMGPGAELFAGSKVVSADLGFEFEVEKKGSETRLQRFLRQVDAVQAHRTSFQMITGRWAERLLKGVLLLALTSMLYFISAHQAGEGLRRVLALLIVTCPCALALATPLVYSLASKSLLKRGVLLKDPECLDAALSIRDLYFDKTGTLTFGELTMDPVQVRRLSDEERGILLGLTAKSKHPISRCVYRTLLELNPTGKGLVADSFIERPGEGVEGVVDGVRYGLRKHADSRVFGVLFYREIAGKLTQLAHFYFEDRLRPEASTVIQALHSKGYRVHLLTGDHFENAARILGHLPIEIRADLSPMDKAALVAGGLMMGDGINDALALRQALIGIAVHGGMEVALDSAGVYALKPGISAVPELMTMAQRVRRILLQNFTISTFYNGLGAGFALVGWMSPLLAAILMPLSAFTVFMNTRIQMRRSES